MNHLEVFLLVMTTDVIGLPGLPWVTTVYNARA
jgi:hypothetical protein